MLTIVQLWLALSNTSYLVKELSIKTMSRRVQMCTLWVFLISFSVRSARAVEDGPPGVQEIIYSSLDGFMEDRSRAFGSASNILQYMDPYFDELQDGTHDEAAQESEIMMDNGELFPAWIDEYSPETSSLSDLPWRTLSDFEPFLTPLQESIIAQDLAKVISLLDEQDVTIAENQYFPVLILAVQFLPPTAILLLLDSGADPNARDARGLSALDVAAEYHRGSHFEVLVRHGASMNDAYLTAVAFGCLDCIKKVCKSCENDQDSIRRRPDPQALKAVNSVAEDGLAPLHLAIMFRDIETVELLLKCGADPELLGRYGTPLMTAIYCSCFDCFSLLTVRYKVNVDFQREDGTSAVHLAAMSGNMYFIDYLLRAGANFNPRGPLGSAFMTGLASKNCNDECLLSLFINADIGMKDSMGQTALHVATQSGRVNWLDPIIDRGEDVNAIDKAGYTPLSLAVQADDEVSIRRLINKGASLRVGKIAGCDIREFARERELKCLRLLIR